MMIKTSDGEKSVASTSLAGAALGLAIPGTVALVNQLASGNGLFGGLFNNGYNNCYSNDTRVISSLEAALAKEKSERYADGIGIEVYKEAVGLSNKNDDKMQANYVQLAQAIAALDKQSAVAEAINAERISCLTARVSNLESLTKLVVPNSSVCPGWGNVTITPATSTSTAA